MAPRVTAVHPERRDRVRIDLDGTPWRTVPAAAAVAAHLTVGTELDRRRARCLRRELRRAEALELAARALAHRDRSAAELAATLARRGIGETERGAAVEAFERAGYVDDARFAASRAAALATRGYGDAGIQCDLKRRGVPADLIVEALGLLAAESERAVSIVATLGPSPKTSRRLAARGFSSESIESAFASSPSWSHRSS